MLRYILRKLAYGIVVLLLVVLTISSIIYLSPVDPATLTQGQRTDTQTVEAVQKQYGLDQPLHVQLGRYFSH
jgi:peptide/nickel transport system permease protein